MADPEIATKALESDAEEVVAIEPPEEPVTQSSPMMGEHCTTDRPTRTCSFILELDHVGQY